MGLPVWPIIAAWLVLTAPVLLPFPFPISALALKNPEVPLLDDYGMPPPTAFWSSIPRRLLPTEAVSPVNGPALMARVDALTGITDAQRSHGCPTIPRSPRRPRINLRRLGLPEFSPSSGPHGAKHSCRRRTWVLCHGQHC